jgi:hypothetical protein
MRNGTYVMDPTPGGSQGAYLYSDGSGNNKTDGSVANPNNYLVVPANYTEQKARDFAAGITDTWYKAHPGDETGTAGPNQALMNMSEAFNQGGSQDLQRHPQWGIPNGSTVPAFIGQCLKPPRLCNGLDARAQNSVGNWRRRSQPASRLARFHH